MSAAGRISESAVGRRGAADLRFPKSARLRKSPEFQAVQRRGRRVKSALFVGVVLPRGPGRARFGLAVSKKVGNAVVRNRVKRHLREAIRHVRGDLDGVDVVIIALPEAANAGSAPIRVEVERICSSVASRA